MWWILQIIAMIGVTIAVAITRKLGVGLNSWIIYSSIAATSSYWFIAKSYALAYPNFLGPWFVGQTALNVLGILVALFIFKDYNTLTNYQWAGLTMSIIGGYLLVR